jgi:hypothetical protein
MTKRAMSKRTMTMHPIICAITIRFDLSNHVLVTIMLSKLAVENYHVDTDFVALEAEWRQLLPFAWADFERFLIGWASEHYKLNGFMKEQTNIALANC